MEVHKNTFDGGLNTDISKNLIPPNKYFEANNVNIAGLNNFFALENIKGSTNLETILTNAADVGVSGVFANKYKIGASVDVECLTIFTYTNTAYTIWCYNVTGDTLYKVFEKTVDSTYSSAKPIMNAVSYPENGFDILYFTDGINEPRKLRCEVTSKGISDPVNPYIQEANIKLLQQGANGIIELDNIDSNGSLFCGSYQFAYQLVNPDTNQYTKFSMFTNPIHVYLDNSTTSVKSGIGLQSNCSIKLDITPSEKELGQTTVLLADQPYTHFRLAVLENIYPDGVENQTVQLTKLELINDYRTYLIPNVTWGPTIHDVVYSANSRVDSMPLSDIVVDKLALGAIKTLAIKENRLVGANITYKDLSLNNGTPAITSGAIIKQDGGGTYDNMFCDAELASKYRGYFRDEVYRFAISYFDADGNFSYPSVLDLSTVTNNQITGSYKDMKFPARSQNIGGTTYTLFSGSNGIQSLGLQLVGLKNHPKWARGFVILRAERLKNILFQTPIIPMSQHKAIGAVEKYPYSATELSGTATKVVSYTTAKPMGPFTTYLPRNYFFLRNRSITTRTAGTSGTAPNILYTGEAMYSLAPSFQTAMIYPPSFMYEDKPFVFSPNFQLKTIDAALVRGRYNSFSTLDLGSTNAANNINTSISGTFYAVTDDQYYYNASHNGAKASIANTKTITDYSEFNNFGSGDVVGGKNFFNHDKFTTSGINWSTVGATQKCGVVVLNSSGSEINNDSALTFSAGSQIARTSTVDFHMVDNDLVHTIEIANMTSGLQDTRYGDYDTPHNFISTGTVYNFSITQLSDVALGNLVPVTVDVWGGDCYVAPHLFKVTDTVYGITNPGKVDSTGHATLLAAAQSWEKAFGDDAGGATSVSAPVPFRNAAQFVEIVLESEYNPSVADKEIISSLTTVGTETVKIPVWGVNTELSCRVPLTYKLNNNHKKLNSQKVFQIKDPLLTEVDNLRARIIYSDQKVYQTSITGFDTFRVLNFKDLQEAYGSIHRLEVIGDELYAFQDNAISYIGIGERLLETTDALTLSVQSGSFIGNIITVSTNSGTQHTGSVISTGNAIYYVDNEKQTICRLSGKQVQVISESAINSALNTPLSTFRANNELISIYDPLRKQIWFVQNGVNPFCYVFDEARNMWVSNYQFAQSALFGGIFTNQKLYIIGKNGNNIAVEDMYTGNRTVLLGTTVTPNVKFITNANMEIAKTFDDILIPCNDRLSTIDFTVTRESGLGDQTASGISLDVTTRGEGNYRAKILRDSSGARLRGVIGTGNIKWQTGTGKPAVAIPSVLTKYRLSDNKF